MPESRARFLSLLREEFPQADKLAYKRIFAGRTIFFDTRTHARLPEYSEPLIFAVLTLVQRYARKTVRERVKLSTEEKEIWARRFERPKTRQ